MTSSYYPKYNKYFKKLKKLAKLLLLKNQLLSFEKNKLIRT